MDGIKRKIFTNISVIPQRHVFAVMGFLATTTVYLIRYSVLMAINTLAYSSPTTLNVKSQNNLKNIFEYCDENNPFCWDTREQNQLMDGFFFGYIVTQCLGGALSDMKGGKTFLGGGILLSSICTLVIPFTARYGINAVYCVRLISGLGCGVTFPALMAMMSQWVPPNERARFGTIIYSGTYAGSIIGPNLSLFIKSAVHESSVSGCIYYVFGLIGVVWCGMWYALCYSSPKTHPFISEKERLFLNNTVVALQRTSDVDKLPWKAFLRCGPLWAVVAILIGHEYCFQELTVNILHYFSYKLSNGVSSWTSEILQFSLVYFGVWISSFLFGILCDYYVTKKYCSISVARKLNSTIAVTGSILCILMEPVPGFNTICISIFILALVFNSAIYCGAWINFLDITPSYAGTMLGIADNISKSVIGSMPMFYVWLQYLFTRIPQHELIIFWILNCLVLLFNIIYIVFGNSKQVWWDNV